MALGIKKRFENKKKKNYQVGGGDGGGVPRWELESFPLTGEGKAKSTGGKEVVLGFWCQELQTFGEKGGKW